MQLSLAILLDYTSADVMCVFPREYLLDEIVVKSFISTMSVSLSPSPSLLFTGKPSTCPVPKRRRKMKFRVELDAVQRGLLNRRLIQRLNQHLNQELYQHLNQHLNQLLIRLLNRRNKIHLRKSRLPTTSLNFNTSPGDQEQATASCSSSKTTSITCKHHPHNQYLLQVKNEEREVLYK